MINDDVGTYRRRNRQHSRGPDPRRWWRPVNIVLGILGAVASIVAIFPGIGTWIADNQQREEDKPRISFAVSQQAGFHLLNGIYITNTGGNQVTVSSVEVRSLSYQFFDLSLPAPCQEDDAGRVTSCSGDHVAIGVFDYADVWRANTQTALYMGSIESCGAHAAEIPAGGRPVAFGIVVRAPRAPDGHRLIGATALPTALAFKVTVTFAGNKLPAETVTFDPAAEVSDPAQDAGMADDFDEIARKCAPDPVSDDAEEAPIVPHGTAYESYLLVQETSSSQLKLLRCPDRSFR